MARTTTVEQVGLTLNLLLFRVFGQVEDESALLSAALRLNPGLAALGPILPLQTVVILPEAPPPRRAGARRVVNLFDD